MCTFSYINKSGLFGKGKIEATLRSSISWWNLNMFSWWEHVSMISNGVTQAGEGICEGALY